MAWNCRSSWVSRINFPHGQQSTIPVAVGSRPRQETGSPGNWNDHDAVRFELGFAALERVRAPVPAAVGNGAFCPSPYQNSRRDGLSNPSQIPPNRQLQSLSVVPYDGVGN